jgi:hypothetical protein
MNTEENWEIVGRLTKVIKSKSAEETTELSQSFKSKAILITTSSHFVEVLLDTLG